MLGDGSVLLVERMGTGEVCNELHSPSAYKLARQRWETEGLTTDLTSQWAGEDGASWQLPSSLSPLLRPVFTQLASLVMMVVVVEWRWRQQQRASWSPVGRAGWEGSQHELSEDCQGCWEAGCSPICSAWCSNREHIQQICITIHTIIFSDCIMFPIP